MSNEMILYLVAAFILGLVLGGVLTGVLQPKSRRYKKVKQELEKCQEELMTQKQTMAKHFSHSAELLDNLAKDFRKLYQHMAENSQTILADSAIDEPAIIEQEADLILSSEAPLESQPPKDYPNKPTGLLKTDPHNK